MFSIPRECLCPLSPNVCLTGSSVFVDLMLWESRGKLVNYVTIDPHRLSFKAYNSSGNTVNVVTVAPQPNMDSDRSEIAQFVTVGCVDTSFLRKYLDKKKVCFKAVHVMLPGVASDRLQSIVHQALGYGRSFLRSQTSQSGFEFSTRGTPSVIVCSFTLISLLSQPNRRRTWVRVPSRTLLPMTIPHSHLRHGHRRRVLAAARR